MSFIQNLSKNLANLDAYLEKYEKELENIQDFFTMEGKKLEFMCTNLPKNMAKFKHINAELKTMSDYLNNKKEELESTISKQYIENSRRALDNKQLALYVRCEPDIIQFEEFILEIAHVKLQVVAIIESLEMMHWQLGHITKVRIASLEEEVL
jgi:hypothetical protein